MYAFLQNQVEQFRKIRWAEATKDYERAKTRLEELLQPFVERLPLEQRLAGLTPDGLAKALDALPPEVREPDKNTNG